jgi:hypothetical protein
MARTLKVLTQDNRPEWELEQRRFLEQRHQRLSSSEIGSCQGANWADESTVSSRLEIERPAAVA